MLIQLLATWIPALLIGLSGVLKLTGNAKIVEGMAALGLNATEVTQAGPGNTVLADRLGGI